MTSDVQPPALAEVRAQLESLRRKTHVLERQADLARLEREWEATSEMHWAMLWNEPNLTIWLLGGVILVLAGGWMFAVGAPPGIFLILLGVATTFVGCLAGRQSYLADQRFEAEREAYQLRRQALLDELAEGRPGSVDGSSTS